MIEERSVLQSVTNLDKTAPRICCKKYGNWSFVHQIWLVTEDEGWPKKLLWGSCKRSQIAESHAQNHDVRSARKRMELMLLVSLLSWKGTLVRLGKGS